MSGKQGWQALGQLGALASRQKQCISLKEVAWSGPRCKTLVVNDQVTAGGSHAALA